MSKQAVFVLSDWLAQLETAVGDAIVLGLDRVRAVAERLQVQSFACPVVTVAGTNGKGSTVATLVWLLRRQGMQVGSYTSPHVSHFQERIQINGNPVSDEQLCAAFAQIAAVRGDVFLTYFEWTTLAALVLFSQYAEPLDVIVLEVGLGGRLDAVNIIDPTIAVVTSIGYDHQAWLGDSLEAIAGEKAGILRSHIPVILGKNVTQATLHQRAMEGQNGLLIEGRDFDITSSGEWYYHESKHVASQDDVHSRGSDTQKKTLFVPPNDLPSSSVSLALMIYTILETQLDTLPRLRCPVMDLSDLTMVGRFFKLKIHNKTIILDVAHNAEGATWLAAKLAEQGFSEVVAVWASLQDKALNEIVLAMKNVVRHWNIGELAVPRGSSGALLKDVLAQSDIDAVSCYANIQAAFEGALAMEGDTIVVFGSFYTVSEVLAYLKWDRDPLPCHGLRVSNGSVNVTTEGCRDGSVNVTREGYRNRG